MVHKLNHWLSKYLWADTDIYIRKHAEDLLLCTLLVLLFKRYTSPSENLT